MTTLTLSTPPPRENSLRALLTEATEHRRRGDIALAVYLEMLAAVAMRTAVIQGRAA
jgi:hypothetical protein